MSEVTQSILFRQKLYENFKDSGLLSQLKTTLRKNLLEQLQKPNQVPSNPSDEEKEKKKPLYLRDKFLACIVLEYLKKSKKEYSLSILLPESNLEEEDCLNYYEIAEIVNLNESEIEGRSFLETLIDEWTKIRATSVFERSTQTDFSEPLSKKLEDIEKQYKPKMDYWKLIPSSKQTVEVSTSGLVKEERMREEFELEKKRIRRELELSVKAEVEKKYESQYDFKTKEMQKAHEGRLTELKNREKSILDSLQRKSKEVEERARRINDEEMKMMKKYETKIAEIEIDHNRKIKELENKEKEIWKRELEIKAKKREYEETIRLIKQKVVEQTLEL